MVNGGGRKKGEEGGMVMIVMGNGRTMAVLQLQGSEGGRELGRKAEAMNEQESEQRVTDTQEEKRKGEGRKEAGYGMELREGEKEKER